MEQLARVTESIMESIKETTKSQEIILSGEDNLTKSEILKNILINIKNNDNGKKYLSFYLEFREDNYYLNNFIQILIILLYTKSPNKTLNNIHEKDCLRHYIKRNKLLGRVKRQLSGLLNVAAAHTTKTAVNIIDTNDNNILTNASELELLDFLVKYLVKVSKKKKIVICIDNYSISTPSMMTTFLSELSLKIKTNAVFIISQEENDQNYNFYLYNNKNFLIKNLTENEIEKVLVKKYKNMEVTTVKNAAKIIFDQTMGKISNVISFIKHNHSILVAGNLGFLKKLHLNEILNNLDSAQRNLVFISSLFPNGLKKKFVYQYSSDYLSLDSMTMDQEISELIKKDILIYNGESGDNLKIYNNNYKSEIEKTFCTDELIDYLYNIKAYLNECLSSSHLQNHEQSYLLHCAIYLFKETELEANVDKIMILIDLQYSFMAFSYIAHLYEKLLPIIHLLHSQTIYKILDSFQKCSEFIKGLTLINRIKQGEKSNDKILLYEAKYMTQLYDYDNALDVLYNIKQKNNEYLYTKLNIIQQKFLNDLAKKEIEEMILDDSREKDKWYYIILRNSAHLFPHETALLNLSKCKIFFKNRKFETATVLNNLAVIYLYNKERAEAKKALDNSISIFKEIGSNEIFEPYCNRSVIYFLNSNKNCLEEIENAIDCLPMHLSMDLILLNVNRIIYEIFFKLISQEDAIKELYNITQNPIYFTDKWTKFIVEYNLYNLSENSEYRYDDGFFYTLKNSANTGFEIFHTLKIMEKNFSIVLGLSPHWRY